MSFPRGNVGLWSLIVAFAGHTHLLLSNTDISVLLFGKSTLSRIVCGVKAVSVFVFSSR